MKKLIFGIFAAMAVGIVGAETNVVNYAEDQKADRAKRIAAWKAKWESMTAEEKAAHRAAQEKKLAEQRAKSGEVNREEDKDGNLTIWYKDGRVVVHKHGK